jgi:protoporphyrinogen oxidase
LKESLCPYYVTNITDKWVPMTAVIEMSNIVDRNELAGRSLVYLPKYVPADDPLFEKSDYEIEQQFIDALKRMYPHFSVDQIDAFRISRTRLVMAIPTNNYSQSLPSQKTSVPGLYLVNSSYILKGNLNVNETIEIAETSFRDFISQDPACQMAVSA